jgi:hypothetical protein
MSIEELFPKDTESYAEWLSRLLLSDTEKNRALYAVLNPGM